VRLILDLSSEIATPSTQASTTAGGATSGASASSNAADQPGLLGMAFPPNFADSGLFYVYFSASSSSAAAGGAAGGAATATSSGGGAATASSSGGSATTATSSGSAMCGNESTMLNHVNRLAEYRLDPSSGIAKYVPRITQPTLKVEALELFD